MAAPDLDAAAAAVEAARTAVETGARHLGGKGPGAIDANQVAAYDLAHGAAAAEIARAALGYASKGEVEARMGCAFVADAVHDVAGRLLSREDAWGLRPGALDPALGFARIHRSPEALASLCGEQGPRHLDADFELVQDTFRRFAEDKIRPVAEHVHRTNADVPEEIIAGLAELGGFGLSVPEEYGGFPTGDESDYMGMVVATEELSRGSLGVGGSLVTRAPILTRAIVAGGTEEQKQQWLPRIASGEMMVGIMVTEPDFGSDVAGVKVTATPTDGGWLVNGVKTWATFAGRAEVLMLLARTDPDRSAGHRGLSILEVEKPRAQGHAFALDDRRGRQGEGRAIA